MSAEILTFSRDASVNDAWNAYAEYATRAVDNPRLLLNRDFFDEMTRREDRYKRLFLARERR